MKFQKYIQVLRRILARPVMRRVLAWLVNTLLLVFFLIVLYQNQHLFFNLMQVLSLKNTILYVTVYIISLLIQAIIWIDMMGYRQHDWQRAIGDFIQTYLMGRLPGGWWKWLGRATAYRAEHLSTISVLWVNVTELLLLIFTGLIIVLILSISSFPIQVLICILYPVTVWKLLSIVMNRKPEFHHWKILWRVIMWCSGYAIAWFLGAFILFRLVAPFSTVPFSIIDALRLGTISGIVGMILQFLPVSTLFRDITLFALLNPFMDLPQIMMVIFAMRLMYGISDLAAGWGISLVLLIMRRYRRGHNACSPI